MIGVTKLIDLLNKPALLYWANKIGLEGVNIRDYESKSQKKGTSKHKQVENYIRHGTVFDGCEILEESLKGYEIIGVESEIKNDYLIGRVDLILRKYDDIYVIDMKSNKNIYLSTKLQLSTYKHMLKAHRIGFMNLDTFEIQILNLDTLKYYNIIKRLYQVKILLDELNERL